MGGNRKGKRELRARKTVMEAIEFIPNHKELYYASAWIVLIGLFTSLMAMGVESFVDPWLIVLLVSAMIASSFFTSLLNRLVYDLGRKGYSFNKTIQITRQRFIDVIFANITIGMIFVVAFLGSLLVSIVLAMVMPLAGILAALLALLSIIYIMIRLGQAGNFILIDGKSVVGSLKASWKTTKPHVNKIFFVGVLNLLVVILILIPFSVTASIFKFMGIGMMEEVVTSLANIIAYPFVYATQVFVFLKITGRKK